MAPGLCLIGVGSPHGDDQVGWKVAQAVQLLAGPDCAVHRVASPLEILNRIDGVDWLGICDACRGSGIVGDWGAWNWPDDRMISRVFAGSHDLGLAATLHLAARLGRLPQRVTIWGVEIGDCQPGDLITAEVMAAIPCVANAIVREIMIAR